MPLVSRFEVTFMLVVRPDVRFFCDLNFDPFLIMQDQNKVYGTLNTFVVLAGLVNFSTFDFRFHHLVV